MATTKGKRRAIEVTQPITITAVKWRRGGEDGEEQIATGVNLTCSYTDENGTANGGPFLGMDPTLSYRDDRIVWDFVCLGVEPDIAAKLEELSEDPENNYPVVLETGTLAELLKYGIGPTKASTFLPNRSATPRKTRVAECAFFITVRPVAKSQSSCAGCNGGVVRRDYCNANCNTFALYQTPRKNRRIVDLGTGESAARRLSANS